LLSLIYKVETSFYIIKNSINFESNYSRAIIHIIV